MLFERPLTPGVSPRARKAVCIEVWSFYPEWPPLVEIFSKKYVHLEAHVGKLVPLRLWVSDWKKISPVDLGTFYVDSCMATPNCFGTIFPFRYIRTHLPRSDLLLPEEGNSTSKCIQLSPCFGNLGRNLHSQNKKKRTKIKPHPADENTQAHSPPHAMWFPWLSAELFSALLAGCIARGISHKEKILLQRTVMLSVLFSESVIKKQFRWLAFFLWNVAFSYWMCGRCLGTRTWNRMLCNAVE